MEFSAQAEGRLMTGREMGRGICHWCSGRSELGQHRISRDLVKVNIDPHKPADCIISILNVQTYISSFMAPSLRPMR
eukprot:840168-Pyramimonas_sp.AAC.1